MKWADHCSSDEESLDDVAEQLQDQATLDDSIPQKEEDVLEEHIGDHHEDGEQDIAASSSAVDVPPERVYNFPEKPPFTAFVGNLNYSIKDPEQLKTAIADAAAESLGSKISVIGGRICLDRDGKHRGFGYVEVETLDEVRIFCIGPTMAWNFRFIEFLSNFFLLFISSFLVEVIDETERQSINDCG